MLDLKNASPGPMFTLILFLLSAACNSVQDNASEQQAEPLPPKLEKLKLQSGFKAEHLYSPSENEMGSWVSMTFDDQGRLITSDQYGALYRMELTPIGSDSLTPKIEKLKIQTEEPAADSIIQMGYAQGLLYAFNSLYVMVNHRSNDEFDKGSGLYRLQDTDNDDQFDKISLLKALEGSGEHGPHSIVMSPDEQSLYVIAGNHTDVPEMDAYRIPKVWQEDNLFPLIKDPRGHANDRMAPGGWIAKIDSLGKDWEMVSVGFRNPFDLAFNQAGDMFTFDSDMEWDLGMPWYRPTRICHVTSGGEFGWRTGNSKWSPAYPDNLPAVLNIGQGSPTGVLHGKSAAFPDSYQDALFAFDWSFGIIYAIHLQPEGASYSAEKEEFISGMPLPLTDGVIGPDGAMYFMTGGRKLDSDLYRVYFDEEQENVSLAAYEEPGDMPEAHGIRTQLEQFHEKNKAGGLEAAWPHLNHEDRFVRYAARVAIEHQPVNNWQERVLDEEDPIRLTQGMVALARHGNQNLKNQMLNKLCEVDYGQLSEAQQVDLVRAFELTLSRMGMPSATTRQAVIDYLNPHYPANKEVLNSSISKVLVYLDDSGVIEKTLTLLEEDEGRASEQATAATDGSDLILRNPQYGLDIAQMLKNVPPAQQTYYATVLSKQRSGWNQSLRERYFQWFYNAFDFQAGNSYIGFIDKARQEALSHVPKSEFEHYNQLSGDSLLSKNGTDLANVPQPEGPWHNWEIDEAKAVLDSGGLQNRNFETGKNMYAATQCITCHSMRGEGGIIGPDLTQLGTRFSPEDMIEAIMEPNQAISDQYASTVLYLKNGQSVVGRLTDQNEESYFLSQNPFAPDQIREIPKEEVTDTKQSAMSVMPPGLINRLNKEELRDLLAYLMAGGNPEHAMYQDGETKAE
ncbi:c-type cytochrome [Catalinimonas niigatensis]|uniref:c-type cytochrome n=1 Tax=Catalinimonas niigatensis TaxID=1397264 RepID=UPI00266581FD|nr:c-type cytochrome [Catalinimonas niigatensis]WPP52828.1 c-type cytochrome [Catalinimonas niigatensis]